MYYERYNKRCNNPIPKKKTKKTPKKLQKKKHVMEKYIIFVRVNN